MIKHNSYFVVDQVVQHFKKRDSVSIIYVCTTALGNGTDAYDVFYRSTPHPQFGNHYFGVRPALGEGSMFICDDDVVEGMQLACVEDINGALHYSAHRHDCVKLDNGNMIDGGRAYTRATGKVTYKTIRKGELV